MRSVPEGNEVSWYRYLCHIYLYLGNIYEGCANDSQNKDSMKD